MSWTRPADLRAQVQKLWDRGELLQEGELAFPRRLVLKGPSSDELAQRFDSVRSWIAELQAMPHCRIELRQFTHRVLGANAVPQTAWIDSLDMALAWIGKRREAERFRALCGLTLQRQPALRAWLARRPLRALDLAGAWPQLLDVVEWVCAHPRCALYLRQIDIPGVHSKFIETHRDTLGELLDLVLPAGAIDAAATGIARFNARYGFRDKPARIRFRVLDDGLDILPGTRQADITLDAASFAALAPPARQVFITENEINFLAFPPVANSLVVFGAGYGWDALAQARWLERCALRYWGDIDTHGFAILDQLRSRFPRTASLLMDRATLMAHQTAWGLEPAPVRHDLPRLDADERLLYDELRDNRIQPGLRLEQERIGYAWLEQALRAL
ncbi:DUF2220 family protein [Pseudoduganella sp. LjRoot289]|uniref:DUF3322 domain-containing protein n=1 Tax=Pseudoduganella sp. LjRoot289 TaxID=3342314 RepID=UPI003ED1238C